MISAPSQPGWQLRDLNAVLIWEESHILRFLFLKHPHRSPPWALMQLETQARCLVTGPLRANLPGYSVIDGTQVLYQTKQQQTLNKLLS